MFLITFSFLFINNFVGIFFVLLTFLSTLFIAYKAVDDFKKIGEDILITEKKVSSDDLFSEPKTEVTKSKKPTKTKVKK